MGTDPKDILAYLIIVICTLFLAVFCEGFCDGLKNPEKYEGDEDE